MIHTAFNQPLMAWSRKRSLMIWNNTIRYITKKKPHTSSQKKSQKPTVNYPPLV